MPMQKFIKLEGNYDVVLMLNSYRNFSEKRSNQREAKVNFDKWLIENAKYFITSNANLPYKKEVLGGCDLIDTPLELYHLPLSYETKN